MSLTLNIFLSRIGLAPDALASAVQFRTLGRADSGGAADVERITTNDGTSVVVTVWEWTRGAAGVDRQRLGRLEFDAATGGLRAAEGTPDELTRIIAGMERLVE